MVFIVEQMVVVACGVLSEGRTGWYEGRYGFTVAIYSRLGAVPLTGDIQWEVGRSGFHLSY